MAHSENLCFACSEFVDPSPTSNEGPESPSSSSCSKTSFQFFNFAQRYLNLGPTGCGHDTKRQVFCESCSVKVNQICELYKELLEVELRLTSKLGELGNLMKQSGESVPFKIDTDDLQKLDIDGIRNFVAAKCLEKLKPAAKKKSGSRIEGSSLNCPVNENANYLKMDLGKVEYIYVENEDAYQEDEDSLMELEHDPLSAVSSTPNIQEDANDEDSINLDPMSEEDGNGRENSAATGTSFRNLYQKVRKLRRDSDNESDYSLEDNNFEPGSDESSKTESSDDSDNPEHESNEQPERKLRQQKIFEASKTVTSTIASGTNILNCVECGRPFSNVDDLFVHLQWHEKQSAQHKASISCYFCFKSFSLEQSQQLHIRIKHSTLIVKDNPFKCDEKDCGASFGNFPDLDNHIATHAKPIHKCFLCHWGFVNPENLKVHEIIHTPNDHGFQCPACHMKTGSVKNLQAHYYRKHGPGVGTMKDFTCPECNVDFACHDHLKRHMKKYNHSYGENGEPPAKKKCHLCPHCNAPFVWKKLLRYHISKECDKNPEINFLSGIRTITQIGKIVKKLPCHVCSKLVRKKNLKTHLETHLPEAEKKQTRVICDLCGVSTANQRSLNSHMDRVHKGIKSKSVECEHCKKTFASQHFLNHHINTIHKGMDLSVICDICGKKLSSKSGLQTHLKTHAEQKQHGCHLCPNRFRDKKYLRKHLVREHGKAEGEEFTPGEGIVLKCVCMFPSCTAKFERDIELQTHVCTTHSSAEKEFMCNLCGKIFAYQARLTRHNLVHTKEKAHECPVCFQTFAYRASMKEHIEAKHEQHYFECKQPNCQSKFKVRKYLSKHLKHAHGVTSGTTPTNVKEEQH